MSNKYSTTEEEIKIPKELGIPQKLSELRWKLGNKAKQEPKFRFYTLYDRIYRKDVLETAYARVRANRGSAGVDNITFEDIEKETDGVENLINKLEYELRNKCYKPLPIKRVYIPKPNGKLRGLGIPCIRDRIVQMAVLLILEPIFEVDFEDTSYGFRPRRGAHDALKEIQENIRQGRKEIYDADLSSYFDTIDHDELMKKVERRIADRQILKLIRMFLTAVIEDKDKDGKITRNKGTCGTPQGGVISPLLSNIYLHTFDNAFNKDLDSPLHFANARLIRYADDFVVLAKFVGGRIVEWIENKIEGNLKLKINKDKTRIVNLKGEKEVLNFLGYSYQYFNDLEGRDWKYLNMFPSRKSVDRMKEKIKEITSKSSQLTLKEAIEEVNRSTRGWSNYFKMGYPRAAFRDINYYMQIRFNRFLSNRSQRKYKLQRDGESLYACLRRNGLQYL